MTRTHVPWKGVCILKCVVEYKINPNHSPPPANPPCVWTDAVGGISKMEFHTYIHNTTTTTLRTFLNRAAHVVGQAAFECL